MKSKASEAARLLGKRSWKSRLKRHGEDEVKRMLSKAGHKATGRPRRPDNEVTPAALYQRKRREKLKKEEVKNAKKAREEARGL